MSTIDLLRDGEQTWLAWETEDQVYFARFNDVGRMIGEPLSPRGERDSRKHPRRAVNEGGRILLVWTEDNGWNRGGRVAWQVYDADLEPVRGARGRAEGIPVWGVAAPVARGDGFVIIY